MFRRSHAKRLLSLERMSNILLQRQSGLFTDDEALVDPDVFEPWAAGMPYGLGQVIQYGGGVFRVMREHTAQPHQAPGGNGMLAVYRPIAATSAGSQSDPKPFVFGMDVVGGLFYTYNNQVWKAVGDMLPCVWPPGTPGLWQWEIAA
jgi:hypothetical protein